MDSSPKDWRPFNSANHGGQSNGEGQNALYADGHSSFLRTPLGGIDSDNIYTLMGEQWDIEGFNRIHGYSPHQSPAFLNLSISDSSQRVQTDSGTPCPPHQP